MPFGGRLPFRRRSWLRDLGNMDILFQPGRYPIMPDRDTVRQTLIELLEADKGEKFPDLDDAKNLRDELGLDSLDVVSIVSQIERRFHLRLSQEELEKLATVADVLDLLEAKLAAAPQPNAA